MYPTCVSSKLCEFIFTIILTVLDAINRLERRTYTPPLSGFRIRTILLVWLLLEILVDLYFLFANLPCQMHSRDSFPRDQKDNLDDSPLCLSSALKNIAGSNTFIETFGSGGFKKFYKAKKYRKVSCVRTFMVTSLSCCFHLPPAVLLVCRASGGQNCVYILKRIRNVSCK